MHASICLSACVIGPICSGYDPFYSDVIVSIVSTTAFSDLVLHVKPHILKIRSHALSGQGFVNELILCEKILA